MPKNKNPLSGTTVLLVGCGTLGTRSAKLLSDCGASLRLVDRDIVEKHNLSSEFKETDIGKPKATVLEERIRGKTESFVDDFNANTADFFLEGIKLIVDGTDNMQTRYLVNEVAVKHGIPYVFGSVIRSEGMVATFLRGRCFRCTFEHEPKPGTLETCTSAGLNSEAAKLVAELQLEHAISVLNGNPKTVMSVFDLSGDISDDIELKSNPVCPVCRGIYEKMSGGGELLVSQLCDGIQVYPKHAALDLGKIVKATGGSEKNGIADVNYRNYNILLFENGRMIIKKCTNQSVAKSVYSEIVSL